MIFVYWRRTSHGAFVEGIGRLNPLVTSYNPRVNWSHLGSDEPPSSHCWDLLIPGVTLSGERIPGDLGNNHCPIAQTPNKKTWILHKQTHMLILQIHKKMYGFHQQQCKVNEVIPVDAPYLGWKLVLLVLQRLPSWCWVNVEPGDLWS